MFREKLTHLSFVLSLGNYPLHGARQSWRSGYEQAFFKFMHPPISLHGLGLKQFL